MLSCNLLCFISTPYNRSLTCTGLTLDINKEKYTKLSVVLFPVVLKAAKFLLPYFAELFPSCVENLLSGYSPPIMQGATACNLVELLFCVVYYFFCNCARGFYYSGYAVMSCNFLGML